MHVMYHCWLAGWLASGAGLGWAWLGLAWDGMGWDGRSAEYESFESFEFVRVVCFG